MAGNRIWSC